MEQFEVTVEKFSKMIDFVKSVRDAQNQYFKTKSQEDLKSSKALEAKLDAAVKFYTENSHKLFVNGIDPPF